MGSTPIPDSMRISDQRRTDILEAHRLGVSAREIARQMGVASSSISRIIEKGGERTARNTIKYSEFYEYATLRIHTQTVAEIYSSFAGEKPAKRVFLAWVKTHFSGYKKGVPGKKAVVHQQPIRNVDLAQVTKLQRILVACICRFNKKFLNPIWKEELIAEMRLIAFQYSTRWDGITIPSEVLKAANKAADSLSRMLGHTRTEESRKARLDAQEWATFDYSTPEGELVRRVCAAYSLWGMDGVLREVNPADIIATEKILKSFFKI